MVKICEASSSLLDKLTRIAVVAESVIEKQLTRNCSQILGIFLAFLRRILHTNLVMKTAITRVRTCPVCTMENIAALAKTVIEQPLTQHSS